MQFSMEKKKGSYLSGLFSVRGSDISSNAKMCLCGIIGPVNIAVYQVICVYQIGKGLSLLLCVNYFLNIICLFGCCYLV